MSTVQKYCKLNRSTHKVYSFQMYIDDTVVLSVGHRTLDL